MKKMYFLKDRKEAVIDRLTYMSKHRQEYLQDKEHGMITLQFKQGMPVIRFSSGRVTSYWDFSFDGKKMTVQRRRSLSDKIIWGTLLIIDLFILYLFRQNVKSAAATTMTASSWILPPTAEVLKAKSGKLKRASIPSSN